MTINLPLQPQEEARLIALAHAKGLSPEALVRTALERILAEAGEIPEPPPFGVATGAELVSAMQASPWKEMALEPSRGRFPVRDVAF